MPIIQSRPVPVIGAGLSHLPPVLQRVYAARRVQSDNDLGRNLKDLPSPWLFKGMRQAVDRLIVALEQQQSLLIVGDFDADGATSSSVMMLGLRSLGFNHVDYMVPNRFEDGYGLTPGVAEQALARRPDVLITVDNGISSHEGVEFAQSRGVDVIVTDHHLQGDSVPDAAAIVNPNQHGCEFPSKAIAGVGVAFFVLMALRATLRDAKWFERHSLPEPNLAELLDLVALGTVADVVALDFVNRIFVYQGIRRIRAGRCRHGIKALLMIAKRDFSVLVASDLGFAVGPRLNAAGRLDDMSVGISCLLAESAAEAHLIAAELDALNADRRSIEQGMQQEAERMLAQVSVEHLPAGLCIHQADWHQGVVGIVASRIKERYYRPVIAFANNDDGSLKGSARSIPGIHIRDVLALVAAKRPDLLSKFGGHAMAAGLSIASNHLEEFQQLFHQAIVDMYCDGDYQRFAQSPVFQDVVWTDGQLVDEDMELQTALLLEHAGPWGQQFVEPQFEGEFDVVSQRIVGEKHLKLQVRTLAGRVIDAIAFNVDLDTWPAAEPCTARMAYTLNINRFRGAQTLQLMVNYLELVT